MRATLLLLILLAVPSYSQFNISLFVGVNPPTNFIADDHSDFLDLYWNSGITVGLSSEVYVSKLLAFSPTVEYAYYGFDNYTFGGLSFPEVRFKSATGGSSKVWRMFAEAKYFPNSGKAVPWYLSTGVGYVIERIGTIKATFEDMNGPNFTQTIQYQGKNFIVHTLGLGIRWSVFSHLALDLKGQYFTNYNDRMHTTARVAIVYTVAE